MKSKNLLIIDTYPTTKKQLEILEECIHKLSNIGFDIMVVSHTPIPNKIQKMVDYLIFDIDNSFLPHDRTPHFWLDIFNYKYRVFNSGHSLAITRNMQNALLLAKSIGYDFFYFLEYDVLINDLDIDKFINLKNEMDSKGKQMIFFEPSDFYECESHVYETLFFGGNVKYMISKFLPPKNLKEWDELSMGYTLELAFYQQLSKYSEDFLIIPKHSSEYFSNSDINVYRYGLLITELLYNQDNPERPTLLLFQHKSTPQEYHIKIHHNENIVYDSTLCRGCWVTNSFELDGSILIIETYLYNELQETKHYQLNDELPDKLKLKGEVVSLIN